MKVVSKKSKAMMIAFIILLITLAIPFVYKITKGYFPMPQGIRRLGYVAFRNIEYQTPVLEDGFLFFRDGYQKSYDLDFKYIDTYTIGILSDPRFLPVKYRYSGKIKVEFFVDGTKVFTKTSDGSSLFDRRKTDLEAEPEPKPGIFKIGLINFEVLQDKKFYKKIKVVITVIEADEDLEKYKENIKLYIGIDQTLAG